MAHKRLTGERPRLLNKPWDDKTKGELQRFLENLEQGSTQVQVDLEILEAIVLNLIGAEELPSEPQAPDHMFLLMGA